MTPGDLLAGRFEIEAVAGAGGMGTVYRALDHHGGARVAVKVFIGQSERSVLRFQREAALLAQLSHPGIVRYVAHGATPQGAQFLVMEWLEGQTLTQHLTEHGPLSVADGITLALRVALALGTAHQVGVVHRDVKPSNLLLPGGAVERVKVLDFGVARHARELQALTRADAMVGTPAYMSPEQARGEREIGPRVDVFSLGCVLYEALSGRSLFVGETVMAVQAKILWQEVPRLRSVVPEDLLARMLGKEPEDRPEDGLTVAAALRAIDLAAQPTLDELPALSLTTNHPEDTRKLFTPATQGGRARRGPSARTGSSPSRR
jgi:serine/threonine protein kinase